MDLYVNMLSNEIFRIQKRISAGIANPKPDRHAYAFTVPKNVPFVFQPFKNRSG
jgi:hypothetical protein